MIRLLLFLVFSLLSFQSFAQEEESISQQSIRTDDSLTQVDTENGERFLSRVDSNAVVDSIAELLLRKQLDELRSSDRKEKERLEAQLDSLQKAKSARAERIHQQVDSLRSSTQGVPVVVFEDTVFYIFTRIGPFNPNDRALSLQKKIELLVDESRFNADQLTVQESEETHDILHEDVILFSLTDRDAFWYDKSRAEAATDIQQSLIESIADYKERTGVIRTLIRFGLLLLVLILLYVLVKQMNRGGNWLIQKSLHFLDPHLSGLKLREYEFLSAEREINLIHWLCNAIKYFLIIIVVYLSLPVIFSIFPSTKSIANQLIGYILSPLRLVVGGFIGYVPELISIIVILLVTRYVVRFIRFLATEIEEGKLSLPSFYPDWAKPTYNLIRIIIYSFAFVMIFPYLPGSDSQVFKGVSVFFGLLISLGSSSAIGNIIAGLVITYMRAFKIGDRVKIGETTGDVVEKTMLITRVRTIKNEEVTIPNSAILNGSTINYSTSSSDMGLILHTTVTIGYDVPWRKVHALLIEAAKGTDQIENLPEPYVLQTSLDDFYVSYQINAFTRKAELAARIYSHLHANIQDSFAKAGVEIMSPHYRANREGPDTTPRSK
jgi:small-conductance mechanosensitive channel